MEKQEVDGFAFTTSRFFPDVLRIRNKLARELICEFFCTFFFLLVGVGCTIQIKTAKGIEGNFLTLNFCWGLSVAFSSFIGGWLSGGHTNPSVSLVQWSLGRLSLLRALTYSIAQILGAFVGTALAYLDYIGSMNSFDGGKRQATGENGTLCMLVTCPAPFTSHIAGLLDQVIGTGILCCTMAAMLDSRNGIAIWLRPFIGGITVMMIGLSFAQNDGYPINAARDLGARIFASCIYGREAWSSFDNYWWVPILGPLIGGFVGAWLYVLLIDVHSWSNTEETERNGYRYRQTSHVWSTNSQDEERTAASRC